MTPYEQGFLLLSSHLGEPERMPLTLPQFRRLSMQVCTAKKQTELRELCSSDLKAIGYSEHDSRRILSLLDDTALLERYLRKGSVQGCFPITRVSQAYPIRLRQKLGIDAPPCLWYKGDLSLLTSPAVSAIGSRELSAENCAFAQTVGAEAAKQGYALVSGNARGADQIAQESCIAHGGNIISVVPDTLTDKPLNNQILWITEDSFSLSFHAARALSRNRIIHVLGQCVIVAQCSLNTGGTWDGSVRNLQQSWNPLCCFDDGSDAAKALQDRGGRLISLQDLANLEGLCISNPSFL